LPNKAETAPFVGQATLKAKSMPMARVVEDMKAIKRGPPCLLSGFP